MSQAMITLNAMAAMNGESMARKPKMTSNTPHTIDQVVLFFTRPVVDSAMPHLRNGIVQLPLSRHILHFRRKLRKSPNLATLTVIQIAESAVVFSVTRNASGAVTVSET